MDCKYIIALGSSAGGLDPIKTFFDHTPLDSAAYFVLQHLPYDYQNNLKNILSRYSELQIVVPENGADIVKNHIYTMPQKKFLAIHNGKIRTITRDEPPNQNWSFNIFLNSLAEEKTSNVIAVVLSGAGTDGTEGILKVKAIGGKVIAQLPETCVQPAMPENAIKTGVVDFIARPEDMPAIIHHRITPEFDQKGSIQNSCRLEKNG